MPSKKNFFFFTIYKMKPFSIKTWSKIGVEVKKHNGK